ncbi:MAG TPA: hypothetical protein VK896_05650 [Gaiellaceae bacterium]|nr:hypothetical protein [Gaiellaceae bacterium]
MALAVVLVRGWPRLVPLPIIALGGVYVAQLAVDDAVLDPSAAAVGAGLLVAAELAYWSLDERERIPAEPGTNARRLAYVAGLGAMAILVGLVLLTLADAFRARGLAIDLLGAVAAVSAVVGVWILARERARPA